MSEASAPRTRRVFLYKRFERFWHWMQALLILLLALTGFEIHGSYSLFGFEQAYEIHYVCAYLFIVLIAFAIFWHFTTGEWKQYLPTTKNLADMVRYYTLGIFRNDPYPFRKNEISKLNPLQRIVYAGLKILVIPVQVIGGLFYMYYKTDFVQAIFGGQLGLLAAVHTIGAYALMAFLVSHVYLTTTGKTPLHNIKAMVTGWEEIEAEE